MARSGLTREVAAAAAHLQGRLDEVSEDFVERDSVFDLLALAAICKEHVLLIGPPGTAKTSILDRFAHLIGANTFTYLLTRFTEPTELFGTIDFPAYQEGRYVLRTENMLPEAEVVFLDEIFQGSSAILNSLLSLLNERKVYSGSEVIECPLITVLGASNDIPTDPTLRAFSDRFLLRTTVDYVNVDSMSDLLTAGWRQERAEMGTEAREVSDFSLDNLQTLHEELPRIDLEPIMAPFEEILRGLRADGITFSDRRAIKSLKVFAAAALLAGRPTATPDDLWPLSHLWTDSQDQQAIVRLLQASGVDLPERGESAMDPTVVRENLERLLKRKAQLASHQDGLILARDIQRLVTRTRKDHSLETELIAELEAEVREVLDTAKDLP